MLTDIFAPGHFWTLNELQAMVKDEDLFAFEKVFVAWDFIESPATRLQALRMMFRLRAVPVGEAAQWVQNGGKLPVEVELQQPRRRPYQPKASR